MKNYTQEEINKIFNELPSDLKEAIQGTAVAEIVQQISKKHKLHLDEAGALWNVVKLTLVGIIPREEFVTELTKYLGTSKDLLPQIVQDVNASVFARVQDSLKEINSKGKEDADVVEGSNMVPQSSPAPLSEGRAVPVSKKEIHHNIIAPRPESKKSVHEDKLEAPKSSMSEEASVPNLREAQLKMIPNDVKSRLSNDPYKESI